MRRDYPGIRFRVVEDDEKSYLRQRRIELGIARASTEGAHFDLHEEALFNDPLVIAAATSNPWARRRKIGLKDIYDGPWIIPFYDSRMGSLIMEGFRAQGLEPPLPHVTSYTITLYLGLLATGPISPSWRDRCSANRWIFAHQGPAVPFRHRPSPVVIVTIRNRTLSPAAESSSNMRVKPPSHSQEATAEQVKRNLQFRPLMSAQGRPRRSRRVRGMSASRPNSGRIAATAANRRSGP